MNRPVTTANQKSVSAALADALAQHRAGRLREAEALYKRVLAADPNQDRALYGLGVIANHAKRSEIGEKLLSKAVSLRPDAAVYFRELGVACDRQGKTAEAEAAYRRCLALDPNDATAHYNLGNCLFEQERLAESVEAYRRAVAANPDLAEAYTNLGLTLRDIDQVDEAVTVLRRALAFKPGDPQALNNLGLALKARGDIDEAFALLHRAIEIDPNLAEAHNNLATVYQKEGMSDEAIAACRRAIALQGDVPSYHYNLAMNLFLKGNFRAAFEAWEWRWLTPGFDRRTYSTPEWDGQPYDGKCLMLYTEQGMGDIIQFIRFAALAKARGGEVSFDCPVKMGRLLRGAAGIDHLVVKGDTLPPFHTYCPLLSLPRVLGLGGEDLAPTIPYLTAEPELVARWRERLAGVAGYRVGVAWQGNPESDADKGRSIPLRHYERLAKVPGVRLICLQKYHGREQIAELGAEAWLDDLAPELDTDGDALVDTAAVMESLDLVITSDTSIAHLAGALARPVWVALKKAPDWRWTLGRDDSPWYPTMRLFRQPNHGDWGAVFDTLAAALAERGENRS